MDETLDVFIENHKRNTRGACSVSKYDALTLSKLDAAVKDYACNKECLVDYESDYNYQLAIVPFIREALSLYNSEETYPYYGQEFQELVRYTSLIATHVYTYKERERKRTVYTSI
jgi:hypothetical protein